mgnify:CR=1 FL=1
MTKDQKNNEIVELTEKFKNNNYNRETKYAICIKQIE